MTPHETGSTATPADARAAAPLTRTFGPQGPTLGDLSDAYLQDGRFWTTEEFERLLGDEARTILAGNGMQDAPTPPAVAAAPSVDILTAVGPS